MIRSIINEEDVNYVVDLHWRIYTHDYNYDSSFIEFFTEPMKPFAKNLDVEKENLWILENAGERKGTIAIMKFDECTAQLRWLLIEPESRNQGSGKNLVEEAVQFCKERGYKSVFLWTNNSLSSARHLYELSGFQIIRTKTRKLSDQELFEEKWELVF